MSGKSFMQLGAAATNKSTNGLFGNRGNNQASAKIGGTQGTGLFSRGTAGGYGGGLGGNKYGFRQQQRPPVPITTLGLPFNCMEKIEKSTNNQRKAYQVYHINMVVMFSQYTTEELRIYDYISSDLIQHFQPSQQMQTQNSTIGYHSGGTFNNQNQSQISQTTVNWYTVPYEKWEKIKEPEDFYNTKSDSDTFYSKPYSNLDPPHLLLTQVTKEKVEAEITPNSRIKLKGFKTSKDTFSSILNKTGKDQSIAMDSSFKAEELKIRNIFSMTQTSRQNTKSNHSKQFSKLSQTKSTRSSISSQPSKNINVEKLNTTKNELTFVPNIYNLSEDENIISNLTISKEKVMLMFPFPVDLRKLDLKNIVKFIKLPPIELDKYVNEINSKKDEKSESLQKEEDQQKANFEGLKIAIEMPINKLEALNDNSETHDDASNELSKTSEDLSKDENSDDVTKTQTLIFINNPIVQHFYIKKIKDETFTKYEGPILNELVQNLKHYPIIILFKKK